jgi:hypothetical protein
MAAWRKRAIDHFPELRQDHSIKDYSLYQLFSDLLPRVEQAHADGDDGVVESASC